MTQHSQNTIAPSPLSQGPSHSPMGSMGASPLHSGGAGPSSHGGPVPSPMSHPRSNTPASVGGGGRNTPSTHNSTTPSHPSSQGGGGRTPSMGSKTDDFNLDFLNDIPDNSSSTNNTTGPSSGPTV